VEGDAEEEKAAHGEEDVLPFDAGGAVLDDDDDDDGAFRKRKRMDMMSITSHHSLRTVFDLSLVDGGLLDDETRRDETT